MRTLFISLITVISLLQQTLACTTAVISGKYTSNGRPIIWKLRDTESFENKMHYFDDGRYNYIGLINSHDTKGEQVWGGANAAGFAIMNSASFNVNLNDVTPFKDQEGFFMKEALQKCSNLNDFEKLLEDRPSPKGLAAHFGVLDAAGNVAFYEVNNHAFKKFDANDPAQAPNGYIIRTNYSFTGKKDTGYGFIRYQTAEKLFSEADAMGELNSQTILQDFSRCLKHSILNKDFRDEYASIAPGKHFINSGDLITRHGSSSALLIEGVTANESPDLATIWTMVGFPNTCLSIPVWLKGGKQLPPALTGNGNTNCYLNQKSLELKDHCYPIKRSSGYKYLNISALINNQQTGYIQRLEATEENIFKATAENLSYWHQDKNCQKSIESYYQWLEQTILATYQ